MTDKDGTLYFVSTFYTWGSGRTLLEACKNAEIYNEFTKAQVKSMPMRLIQEKFEPSFGNMGAKIHKDVMAKIKNTDDRSMVDLLWETTTLGHFEIKVVGNTISLREVSS